MRLDLTEHEICALVDYLDSHQQKTLVRWGNSREVRMCITKQTGKLEIPIARLILLIASPPSVAEMNTSHLQSGGLIWRVCCRCFGMGGIALKGPKDGKGDIGSCGIEA